MTMEAIPLTAPDGTVYAYACAACHHVAGGMSYGVAPYSAENVAHLASASRDMATRCCACRECGAYAGPWAERQDRNDHCPACWEGGARATWEAFAEQRRRASEAYDEAREDSLTRAMSRAAALELEAAMSDLSEECHCAGWLIGCEDDLWAIAQRGPGPWGMGAVTAEDIARLTALSEACGGWWQWRPAADGVGAGRHFVPLDEWIAATGGEHER